MMSSTSSTGIFSSLSTVTLDAALHSSLMALHLNSSHISNHSSDGMEPLNSSEQMEKNWPALLFLIIIILTIGGNILVILAVSLEKKLQNATNFFLRSLAVADMLVGILVMPVSLINILYGVSMPIPVIGLHNEDKVFVNGSCVLNEDNFILIGSFVAFFIPLIIMVVTYCLTVQVLQRQANVFLYEGHPKQPRRSSLNCLKKDTSQTPSDNISIIQSSEGASQLNSPVNRDPGHGRKGMMQAIKNERRASKILGVVFFLFLLMWCPFFITNVMNVLCKNACNTHLLEELLNVFAWVGYVSSGINPLVYTLFNKTYRQAFSNYICCQYRNNKKAFMNVYQAPVATPTMYSKDVNLNSNCRNGNELNSMDLDDTDEALEMQPGTSEVSINSCNVTSDHVSCV
ncbi:5-hydroxytryptamine receptor 2C isoform X2 [Lepisosteus oculatus]|uniref:5-hydroxytryptamine receptor 2C isoform X2 n=1 Tax=Lepisosteus oculatus TaxID=7918 RepID=UPI00371A1E77